MEAAHFVASPDGVFAVIGSLRLHAREPTNHQANSPYADKPTDL
jgi:hypothetical protein